MGTAPAPLVVLPISMGLSMVMPVATINDHIPFLNILPYGLCNSPSNPMVAAATTAALGVLTPMPCIPMTIAPWMPGSSTVMMGGMPALNNASMLMCMWGGVIQITVPGQMTTLVP